MLIMVVAQSSLNYYLNLFLNILYTVKKPPPGGVAAFSFWVWYQKDMCV